MGFLGTLGSIGGALGGFALGGPAGAVAGARIGGQLGTAIGGGDRRVGFTTFAPAPQQPQIPTGPIGGRPGFHRCPPGTRCVGFGIGGSCVGSCVPFTAEAPGQPMLPPAPSPFGPNFPEPPPQQPTGGCACGNGGKRCACCLPGGGMGKTNRTGYYVYGRCGNPANATYVPPGTRCVRSRRLNPANGQAAIRAIRRVEATHNLLKRIDKRMNAVARRSTRGRRATTS